MATTRTTTLCKAISCSASPSPRHACLLKRPRRPRRWLLATGQLAERLTGGISTRDPNRNASTGACPDAGPDVATVRGTNAGPDVATVRGTDAGPDVATVCGTGSGPNVATVCGTGSGPDAATRCCTCSGPNVSIGRAASRNSKCDSGHVAAAAPQVQLVLQVSTLRTGPRRPVDARPMRDSAGWRSTLPP